MQLPLASPLPRVPRARPTRRPQGYASLFASLVPGALFGVELATLSSPAFARLREPSWELAVIAVAGGAATLAGVADWIHHRTAGVAIGPNERRAELAALVFGGVPLFGLMSGASVMADPRPLLLPILVVLVGTVVMICYDELLFHRRRCSRYETALHRVLVFGHAAAFLAWIHVCFVGGGHG